jgi:flagellar hook-length control protein FliK
MTLAFPLAQASGPKAPAYGHGARPERQRAASEAFALPEAETRPDAQYARKAAPRNEEPLRETRPEQPERGSPERDVRDRARHEARHDERQRRSEVGQQDRDASRAREAAASDERAHDKARDAAGREKASEAALDAPKGAGAGVEGRAAPGQAKEPNDKFTQDQPVQDAAAQDGAMEIAAVQGGGLQSEILQGGMLQGEAFKAQTAQAEAATDGTGAGDMRLEDAPFDASALLGASVPVTAQIAPGQGATGEAAPALDGSSAEGLGVVASMSAAAGEAANGPVLAIAGASVSASASPPADDASGPGEAATAGADGRGDPAASLASSLDAAPGGASGTLKASFAAAALPGAPQAAPDAASPTPAPGSVDAAQGQAQVQAAAKPEFALPPGLEMLMKAARDGADPGASLVDGSPVQPGLPHGGRASDLGALGAAASAAQGGQPADIARPLPPSAVPVEIGLRALQGLKEFQIRLDPAELGRVDVKLEIGDDKSVNARVVVERVETLHLLQREAKTLERAFEQAGLKAGDAGIDISLRDPGQQGRQGQAFEAEDFLGEAGRARGADAARIEAAIVPIRRTLHRGALDLSI